MKLITQPKPSSFRMSSVHREERYKLKHADACKDHLWSEACVKNKKKQRDDAAAANANTSPATVTAANSSADERRRFYGYCGHFIHSQY